MQTGSITTLNLSWSSFACWHDSTCDAEDFFSGAVQLLPAYPCHLSYFPQEVTFDRSTETYLRSSHCTHKMGIQYETFVIVYALTIFAQGEGWAWYL